LHPLAVVADLARSCGPGEPGSVDQGERVYVRDLASALARRTHTLVYSTASTPLREVAADLWRVWPRALLYVYPITPAGAFRARGLKAAAHGAPLSMLALAPHPLTRRARGLVRAVRPDLYLTTSNLTAREVAGLGARARRLPPAVDLTRFRAPAPGEKATIRAAWGLPRDQRVVLHIGHAVPARNLDVLAKLARPDTCPVLLASHVRVSETAAILERLRRRKVLVLTGYRPNVEELYRAADCYVFPADSWGGGIDLPASVLEALASDLPVASTPFGGLPEHFEGADGVRFATSSPGLVEAVFALLAARPSTRRLVTAFTWDALASELDQLLAFPTAKRRRRGEAYAARA
jgi:glycosyltransferase involved in cell wall biosynthesis